VVTTLVIDVGTTSVRSAIVDTSGRVSAIHQRALTIATPNPGEVELDALEIATLALACAHATLDEAGPADFVGIANQRATTIMFDAATKQPIGPALGWQDLRTVIDCLMLQPEGVRVAPNQLATKAKWLFEHANKPSGDIRFATIESWLTFILTDGAHHVSDHSNVGLSGLINLDMATYDQHALSVLGLREEMLPRVVPTAGEVGRATALPGAPLITALIGDQPSSLFGQNCVRPGQTKITFGTGAMLDQVRGAAGPTSMSRYASGCFPTPTFSTTSRIEWGVEGIMLSAGTCIEWLQHDLGLISQPSDTESLARSVEGTDGVTFVPALAGLGTPQWDFGARGAFFGLTRGSTKAHLVRAVLDGIVHNSIDLIDAAIAETGFAIDAVRVDGGMTANSYLVQALADASGRTIEVSGEREATTRGAGLMALVAANAISVDDVAAMWQPSQTLTPQLDETLRVATREQWADSVRRAEKTIPGLSGVSF
jgi:glycerol kinase